MPSQRRRCSVVRRLTPLLLGVGCVVSRTTAGAETRRVHCARGVGGGVCECDAPLPCVIS